MSIYELIEQGNYEDAITEIKNGADVAETGGYADDTLVHIAAKEGNMELLELLKEKGCDLNTANKYDEVPFLRAFWSGDVEPVKFFIDNGAADLNDGLLIAAKKANLDLLKYFIEEKGVDVNYQKNITVSGMTDIDTVSYTALQEASKEYEGLECVKYLIEKGADVNNHGSFGNTALHMSASDSCIEIAQYLIDNGADKKAKNNDDKRAFQYADKKQKEVKKILK